MEEVKKKRKKKSAPSPDNVNPIDSASISIIGKPDLPRPSSSLNKRFANESPRDISGEEKVQESSPIVLQISKPNEDEILEKDKRKKEKKKHKKSSKTKKESRDPHGPVTSPMALLNVVKEEQVKENQEQHKK